MYSSSTSKPFGSHALMMYFSKVKQTVPSLHTRRAVYHCHYRRAVTAVSGSDKGYVAKSTPCPV